MLSSLFRKSKPRNKPQLHFLHIGKTGGTAIRHALQEHHSSGNYQLVMHSHPTTLRDVPAGEGVVFFLRDPVSRFVSGFWSRFRKGRPRYDVQWTENEERAFTQFETPLQLATALGSESDRQRHDAETAMSGINHVRFRYADWLVSIAELEKRKSDIFFIGFQESLVADFKKLVPRLGIDLSLELPGDKDAAHRTPSHLKQELSEEARENLMRWYAEDYELLDYCKQLADGTDQR